MESKEPITAEEFIKNRFIYEPKIFSRQEACDLMHEYAVLFAKHHRNEAMNAIAFYGDVNNNGTIDMDSIINAYPENEIK